MPADPPVPPTPPSRADRNRKLLSQWVEQHWDALVRFAATRAYVPHDAEDTVQHALMALTDKLSDLDLSERDDPKGYLMKFVANTASSHTGTRRRRAQKRERLREKRKASFQQVITLELYRDDRPDHELQEERFKEHRQKLTELLPKLPPKQRRAMELKLAEKTDEEIADELGVKPGTVRTYLSKAVKALRKMLQEGQ